MPAWTRRIASIAAATISAALLMTATEAADARKGGELARRWCASCHVVSSDQRQPAGEAAPFSAMAALAGFDEARLAYYLLAPHPNMPDLALTRDEVRDLAAYIAIQK